MDCTYLHLSLIAIVAMGASGVPGLACDRLSSLGQALASGLLVGGALLGAGASVAALAGGAVETVTLPGPLPELALKLQLDPLAAFFGLPVYLLGIVGTVYGMGYWRQADHPENGRKLRLCFGVLIAAMLGVVLAADGLSFLLAWEIMAVAAFLLVTTEDDRPEVNEAGWVYLVSTHVSSLALFALFGVLWAVNGSLELRPVALDSSLSSATEVMFVLAFVGFGLKAGIVPMHFWLPAAHANAPSHVSALLSGGVLKMGIYGLLRILTLLPAPPAGVGILLLAIGALSALYGVMFALGQHDLKRLLAYHSVENIGIILMGLGLALIGVGTGRPEWAALGLGGCLLHVWNHALFKALLFLAAGAVIHRAGTREIDRLGGVARAMGRTATLFAVGAAAICGLPPLNGFVSELMIFVGLFGIASGGEEGAVAFAPLAAPVLALAGALAIACFVKAFGTVFLGPSRSDAAVRAREAPRSMLAAMSALAVGCIAIGAFPLLVTPLLDRVVHAWVLAPAPPVSLGELLSWRVLVRLNGALAGIALCTSLVLQLRSPRARSPRVTTWDCGYARPTPSMAYTAASFAGILVGLNAWLLRPSTTSAVAEEFFPAPRSFHSSVSEPVIDLGLTPLWVRIRRVLLPLRGLQHGRIQQYLLYVLLTLCALLAGLFSLQELPERFLTW